MRPFRWLAVVGAAAFVASCADEGWQGPIDADGDGFSSAYDCDDANAAIHTYLDVYPDQDGDGVGAGTWSHQCSNGAPPAGYALQGTDCAPADPEAWRAVDLYDRDGDGFTSRESLPACAGATLPQSARTEANGNDCDDADAALFRWVVVYPDGDGDGVGARPRSIHCLAGTIPSGWSRAGHDADDADPAVTSDPGADELSLVLD